MPHRLKKKKARGAVTGDERLMALLSSCENWNPLVRFFLIGLKNIYLTTSTDSSPETERGKIILLVNQQWISFTAVSMSRVSLFFPLQRDFPLPHRVQHPEVVLQAPLLAPEVDVPPQPHPLLSQGAAERRLLLAHPGAAGVTNLGMA